MNHAHEESRRDVLANFSGVFSALAAAATWGLGLVAIKASIGDVEAAPGYLAVQLASSLTALVAAAVLTRRPILPNNGRLGFTFGTGILEYALAYGLMIVGLGLTSVTNAALIGASEPILIAVMAWVILREPFDRSLRLAILVSALGLGLVVTPDIALTGMTPAAIGDLLILAGAAAGAAYAVASRHLLHKTNALTIAIAQQLAGLGALVAALAVLRVVAPGTVQLPTLSQMPSAILTGILVHGVAVWLHLHALRRMSAGMFSTYLALVPVFAIAAASLFLGEQLTILELVGSALLIAAVAGAQAGHMSSPKAKEKAHVHA